MSMIARLAELQNKVSSTNDDLVNEPTFVDTTNCRCSICNIAVVHGDLTTCDDCKQKDRTRRANKGFRDTLMASGIEDPMDLYWAICDEAPQTSHSTLIKLKKLLLNLPRKATN